MAEILTSTTPGDVTTPEGVRSRVLASPLTSAEASLLRTYAHFLAHHHLNVVRVCQLCQTDVDIAVRPEMIGSACACRLRTFQGPTPGSDLALSPLPVPSAILGLDGEVTPGRGVFSMAEAALLNAYKRRILRTFNWKEKAFCDDCFSANRKEGTSFAVTDDQIGLRCRCREQTFGGGAR